MSSSFFKNRSRPGEEAASPRINAGVREEEVCRILNLKKHLDYSDVLIQYTSRYLSLGWDLVAVASKGQANLGLNFQEPETRWSQKLVELGLDGVQVNLGVRTGSASRLLVLEVHRQNSLFPFNQPGDWCSNCVAEVGRDRQQHYYEIPAGWRPPRSYFISDYQIMVFGEEGLVLAPPSVEPQVKANLRWLRPPWENPLVSPEFLLKKLLQTNSPPSPTERPPRHEPPAWEEVYPVIARHPQVMQAVLAPANGNYYERLLEEALEAGLKDSRLLLGLLWHAPQGEVRQQPQGLAFLEELLNKRLSQEDPEWWWPEEEEEAGLSGVALPFWGGAEEAPSEIPAPSDPVVREMSSFGGARPDMPPGSAEDLALDLKTARGQMRDWFAEMSETWREVFQFSQDNLLVERRRYEAMIYELGKLGVWQEISRRERRENQLLKEQLESQWQRELNYLRQLLKKKR